MVLFNWNRRKEIEDYKADKPYERQKNGNEERTKPTEWKREVKRNKREKEEQGDGSGAAVPRVIHLLSLAGWFRGDPERHSEGGAAGQPPARAPTTVVSGAARMLHMGCSRHAIVPGMR